MFVKDDWTVGDVVAAYGDCSRKGKWTPAIIVSANALKASMKEALAVDEDDIILRSFRDSK